MLSLAESTLRVAEVFGYPLFFVGLSFAAGLVIEQINLERERERALWEADAYLSALMDEIAEQASGVPLQEIRGLLYEFDEREKMVKRPEQSWALIPHAEELKARLHG